MTYVYFLLLVFGVATTDAGPGFGPTGGGEAAATAG